MLSRVMNIDGQQGQIEEGASLVSEHDVSISAWFYERVYANIPYTPLMEIAL